MTLSSRPSPWLRLVYDSAELPTYSEVRSYQPEQLSLPFPEPDLIVIIDVEEFQYRSFKRALYHLKPKWVFDIRAAPRMDKIAGGRAHAFREFERLGTRYIDIFGMIGISNYRNAAVNPLFWTPIIEDFLRFDGQTAGPYLALLDDDMLINTVSRHFASSISHVTGRDVALSRLKSNADVLVSD